LTIKAVLFDFGDTLINTEKFDYDACLRKVHQNLARNGIAVPYNDFKRIYFDVRDRFYEKTAETLEEQDFADRVTETLKPLGIELPKSDKRVQEAVEVFLDAFINSLRIEAYLPQLLEQLSKKYKLAVVSNMSFAKAVFRSLKKFDIAKYFDAIIISGNVGWRKPSSKIFLKALDALNVKPSQAVFVGDSPKADIEGAKTLGIKTVLVTQKEKKTPSTDTFQLYIDKGTQSGNPDKAIMELAQLLEALNCLSKQS